MSRICDLPEEMMREILIRLPVKSIGKSRCVSKHWNSLLTSPLFINTHLARSSSLQKNLLMLRNYNSLFKFTLLPDGIAEGSFENRDSFPTLDHNFLLVGHYDGLVLIGTQEAASTGYGVSLTKTNPGSLSLDPVFLLMNPTTFEHLRLPHPPKFYSSGLPLVPLIRIGSEYGLGYDKSSDDYKAVHLFVACNITAAKMNRDKLLHPEFCYVFANVYSFKNKCWRRVNIEHRPFSSNGVCDGPGVCVDGALHWACTRPKDTIVAFCLATEKCYEFLIPGDGDREHKYVVRLTSVGSCLGIICCNYDVKGRIDIWTMNEYGIAESWTKKVVVHESADMIGRIPWFWRDTLVVRYPYKLTFYAFSDDKSFSMTLDTRTIHFDDGQAVDGLIFAESLVSPLSL